jgi:LacI family transcriptional regulator
MARQTVTIKELAKELGISKSTVSRALRGSSEIGEETKLRVLELARARNYSPNPFALSLLNHRTYSIGVIVPEIANPFFSSVIGGIEEVAYQRGYQVMIYQSHDSYEREVSSTRHLLQRRADGLLISIASGTPTHEHFRELAEASIPVVFFDRAVEEIQTHKVLVDDYGGAFQATEHLILQGCKRIAHIAGVKSLAISRNRAQGYKDALIKYGLEVKDDWIVTGEFKHEVGAEAAFQLMALKQRPDAIFAASDRIAIGAHAALRQLGYRMPEDVALMGFSDLAISSLLDPPLSTMVQPTFEMGRQSGELLLDLLEAKKPPVLFETRVLKPALMVRRSSQKAAIVEAEL